MQLNQPLWLKKMKVNYTCTFNTLQFACVDYRRMLAGDPHSHVQEMKKVWIPKGETNKVSMAEAISTDPARLAVNLLTVFFCKEELGSGNCTPAPGRQLLNPAIIQGIRCKQLILE